jgi:hypothetical protein
MWKNMWKKQLIKGFFLKEVPSKKISTFPLLEKKYYLKKGEICDFIWFLQILFYLLINLNLKCVKDFSDNAHFIWLEFNLFDLNSMWFSNIGNYEILWLYLCFGE